MRVLAVAQAAAAAATAAAAPPAALARRAPHAAGCSTSPAVIPCPRGRDPRSAAAVPALNGRRGDRVLARGHVPRPSRRLRRACSARSSPDHLARGKNKRLMRTRRTRASFRTDTARTPAPPPARPIVARAKSAALPCPDTQSRSPNTRQFPAPIVPVPFAVHVRDEHANTVNRA